METILKSAREIKNSWRQFVERGAVAPSSRYLARRMSECLPRHGNPVVVELGAGTGSLTQEILRRLPKKGRLVAIEVKPRLAESLKQHYSDSRFEVITGNAMHLSDYLVGAGIGKVDYVISGLPLGNFPRLQQMRILTQIKDCLSQNGVYVQFQYFLASVWRIKRVFQNVEIGFEPRNIPPAFILTCTKNE